MSAPRMIGLSGLAGSGKTTAAVYLEEEFGFTRLPFAGPLKAMARAFGLTAREMAADLKEVPSADLCGKSPRQFMQLLGTEFGRKLIGEDLWVNAWGNEVDKMCMIEMRDDCPIVADDVRFDNEARAIRSRGGIIIRIDRVGAGSTTGGAHESERLAFEPDLTIRNDGTLADLHAAIRKACALRA